MSGNETCGARAPSLRRSKPSRLCLADARLNGADILLQDIRVFNQHRGSLLTNPPASVALALMANRIDVIGNGKILKLMKARDNRGGCLPLRRLNRLIERREHRTGFEN